jgi:hypothetical protein
MPKANISRLTGLDIQPDPNYPNSPHGFYVPQLTTAQRDKLTTVANGGELRNGAVIYNTTANAYQAYQVVNGASVWVNLNTGPATTATGVGLTSGTPLVLPSGPRANVEVAENQVVGFTYYDTTNRMTRQYASNADNNAPGWVTIFATGISTSVGAGLANGGPMILPHGARGAVEVVANQVEGFTYYDTTNGMTRQYITNGGGAGVAGWVTVFANATATATGAGLANGSPMVLPQGARAQVEVVANQVPGFTYFDTSNTGTTSLRHYRVSPDGTVNGWYSIYEGKTQSGTQPVAGFGLDSTALIIPSGPATLEALPGNENNGPFLYYDTDNNCLKARIDGAWVTIATS